MVSDTKHPSHETRGSDSSSFDTVCAKCGATDIAGGGWGDLAKPCGGAQVVSEATYGKSQRTLKEQRYHFMCEHDSGGVDVCDALKAAEQRYEKEEAIFEHRIEDLEAALSELVAVVRGESPSLLDEDSGGDAELDYKINQALANKDKEVELSEPPFCAWCGGTCECDPEYSDQEVEQDDSKD